VAPDAVLPKANKKKREKLKNKGSKKTGRKIAKKRQMLAFLYQFSGCLIPIFRMPYPNYQDEGRLKRLADARFRVALYANG
jgi:hypothetical protein